MHKRRKILEEIAEQLRTLPQFSAVYIQRIPSTRIAFPYLTIYAEREDVETVLIHPEPRWHDRRLVVVVTSFIKGTVAPEKAEEDMDNAALAIELVMNLPTISDADTIDLLSTDFSVDEVDPEVHRVSLTYQVTYNVPEFGAEY